MGPELRRGPGEGRVADGMNESGLGLGVPPHMSYYLTIPSCDPVGLHTLTPKVCYIFFSQGLECVPFLSHTAK